MASIVVKDIPEKLHSRLKAQAKEHRRSMSQEIMTILENGLSVPKKRRWPPLIKANVLITDEMINEAKREGRA